MSGFGAGWSQSRLETHAHGRSVFSGSSSSPVSPEITPCRALDHCSLYGMSPIICLSAGNALPPSSSPQPAPGHDFAFIYHGSCSIPFIIFFLDPNRPRFSAASGRVDAAGKVPFGAHARPKLTSPSRQWLKVSRPGLRGGAGRDPSAASQFPAANTPRPVAGPFQTCAS
jgi:hypothetical protein